MPTHDERTKTATVSQWMKKEGEKFEKGEVLFVVQTPKTALEVEAPERGIILRIYAKEGTSVTAGETVALYAAEGEKIPPDLAKPPQPGSVIIRLTDEKDALVTDASVSMNGERLTLTTEGEFTVATIPPGHYSIHVTAAGFLEKFFTVTVREGGSSKESIKLVSYK